MSFFIFTNPVVCWSSKCNKLIHIYTCWLVNKAGHLHTCALQSEQVPKFLLTQVCYIVILGVKDLSRYPTEWESCHLLSACPALCAIGIASQNRFEHCLWPVTGFSFSDVLPTHQQEVGDNLYELIHQWFQLFPEYRDNPFFPFGESYGGRWIPTITRKIIEENDNPNNKQ